MEYYFPLWEHFIQRQRKKDTSRRMQEAALPAFYCRTELLEVSHKSQTEQFVRHHLSKGKGTIAQLNYNRIGMGLPFHRAIVQRIIRELLTKLGSHILCNQLLQVQLFPVGTFVRRRGGRFRFQFDAALLSYLSGDAQSIELDNLVSTPQQQQQPAHTPQNGWHTTGSPTARSPTGPPPASPSHSAYHERQPSPARPPTHAATGFNTTHAPKARPISATASLKGMHASAFAPMTPRSLGIATLRGLCSAADWARNGRVPRLQIERWLNGECRALTSQMPATAIFDLLQNHSCGRSGSTVTYAPLLDALSSQLNQMHWQEATGFTQVPVSAQPSASPRMPASPTAAQMYGMADYQPHGRPHMFQPQSQESWQAYPALQHPQHNGATAAAPTLANQEPYPYFMQCDLAPRNRADCDAFNRFHFQRLSAARQAAGGGITPKVGNDPLTVYEAEYTKQVVRNRSASPMGRNDPRALSAMPAGQRDLSPGAAPPGFRPATAQPATHYRSMSAAPERPHEGWQGAPGEPAAQTHAGPEIGGYDGQHYVPLPGDCRAPSPARFAEVPANSQVHIHPVFAADPQMAMQHGPANTMPPTVSSSPVVGQPAHAQGEDGTSTDKHVSFQHSPAHPQQVMQDTDAHQNQQQQANGSVSQGNSPVPPPHPGTRAPTPTAPGLQQAAAASITFRPDQAHDAQSAGTPPTAQDFNRSPSPMHPFSRQAEGVQTPNDMQPQQKHVFAAPDALAEQIANGVFGEAVMQQQTRGRSPMRVDADRGDENAQPWNAGGRWYIQDNNPVRSNRDPSPVKQLLNWNAPAQEYKCPRSQFGPRPETAESVRKSYELQIQQREALHDTYAQAESKWPYQPIHHPEARFAYFNSTRYIGPKHVRKEASSNRL